MSLGSLSAAGGAFPSARLAPQVSDARCRAQGPGVAGPPRPAPEGGLKQRVREGWRGGEREGEAERGMEEGGEAGMLPVGAPRFPLALLHPAPILQSISSGREHPQTLLAVTSPGCSCLLLVGEEGEAPRERPRALPAGPAPGPAPAAPAGGRSCPQGPRSAPGGAPHPTRANKVKP